MSLTPVDTKMEATPEKGSIVSEGDVDGLVLDAAQERKLMRKIDWHLIPWLSVLYLLSFLDRTAIGNARLYGLQADLGISNQQFQWCLTVFFFPYAAFEIPSNILLKKLRPSIWLSLITFLCGIAMMVQGFCVNYHGLLVSRFFLGSVEAGLFPGINYYLSTWYKRRELGIRIAFFFSACTISGAFGGLLAFAIGSSMVGVLGRGSWAWIFIIEGAFTMLCGVLSLRLVHDFSDTARFLTPEERIYVVNRLKNDNQFSAGGEAFAWSHIGESCKDWKTWISTLIYIAIAAPVYGVSLFIPTIINGLGYTANQANLLSIPIFVWACGLSLLAGYIGDRIGRRSIFNFICFSVAIVGCIMLISSSKPALSYVGLWLVGTGLYPQVASTLTQIANNTEGSYKRSVTIAIAIGMGNLHGAVTSNVFLATQKPRFPLGYGILIGYLTMGLLSSIAYFVIGTRENARRDRGERDEVIGGEPLAKGELRDGKGHGGWYATLDECKRAKGDNWSGFRYIL